MSSDDYQVQNVFKYSRKTYKKSRREPQDDFGSQSDVNIETADTSPRSVGMTFDTPGCSCDRDPEGDIAHILHKKYPVITLAQQQLQKLLDDTDMLLCDNTKCCRSVYDFLCICKAVLLTRSKLLSTLVALIVVAFFLGLLFGAATCGSYLGRFNSPILTCIDNYFIPHTYTNIEDTYRSIV